MIRADFSTLALKTGAELVSKGNLATFQTCSNDQEFFLLFSHIFFSMRLRFQHFLAPSGVYILKIKSVQIITG